MILDFIQAGFNALAAHAPSLEFAREIDPNTPVMGAWIQAALLGASLLSSWLASKKTAQQTKNFQQANGGLYDPTGTSRGLDTFLNQFLGSDFAQGISNYQPSDPFAAVEGGLQRAGIGQPGTGGGGRRGGGGGGGGGIGPLYSPEQLQQFLGQAGQTGSVGDANNFLSTAFSNPDLLRGQIDPTLLGLMTGTQGAQGDLLNQFVSLIGGEGNPILAELLGSGGGVQGYALGGGGGGGGQLVRAPDIQLRELNPETLSQLASGRASELSSYRLGAADREDRLLSSLFGRGLERSTVALDEAGRLDYGEGQMVQQIMANYDQQVLQLQETDAERRARLAQTEMQANAQIIASRDASNASAGAAAASARYGSLAQVLAAQIGGYSSLFGNQTGFNQSALGSYGDLAQTLTTADAGVLQQLLSSATNLSTNQTSTTGNLLQQLISSDASMRAARMAANASRYGAGLDFATSQGQLAGQENQNILNFILQMAGVANQRFGLGLQGNQQQYDQMAPNSWAQVASVLPQLLQAYNASRGGGG